MIGNLFSMEISWALRFFFAVIGNHAPAFTEASLAERTSAEALYAVCGYKRGIADSDNIFLAKFAMELCGVMRFAPENGVRVLRGMQILPDFQRKGIGTQFLRYSLEKQESDTFYCIAKLHLEGFYSNAGFKTIGKSLAPKFLQQRLDGYIAEGLDVILMVRTEV